MKNSVGKMDGGVVDKIGISDCACAWACTCVIPPEYGNLAVMIPGPRQFGQSALVVSR